MKVSPSVLATWAVLASSSVWAHQIRGTNSNHISHGQNDIRQLEGSDGVYVTVTVDAVGNDVNVSGNKYADAVPPPTPTAGTTPEPSTTPPKLTCGLECFNGFAFADGCWEDPCGADWNDWNEYLNDANDANLPANPCGGDVNECALCAGAYNKCGTYECYYNNCNACLDGADEGVNAAKDVRLKAQGCR